MQIEIVGLLSSGDIVAGSMADIVCGSPLRPSKRIAAFDFGSVPVVRG
jgi:hypothetical protein